MSGIIGSLRFCHPFKELQRLMSNQREQGSGGGGGGGGGETRQPLVLRYALPYPQDPSPPPLVPQRPADLQYGNPYSTDTTKGCSINGFSPV